MGSSQATRFHLPDRELTWRFSRSSGPGGQHVNTTDTRVELSWAPAASGVLTDAQKSAVARHLHHRLVDGTITVVPRAAGTFTFTYTVADDAGLRSAPTTGTVLITLLFAYIVAAKIIVRKSDGLDRTMALPSRDMDWLASWRSCFAWHAFH